MIVKTPFQSRQGGRMREFMENQNNKETLNGRKKITSKQIVAFIGVILLVLLYIATLFAAIFDNSDSGRWFMSCIVATVAVPLLIWIYTWMYGKLTGRHTIADANQGLGADLSTNAAANSPDQSDSNIQQ